MLSSVARVGRSYKSGPHEWRRSTQAQLTRRDIVETSMSWAESDTGRLVAAISEEGKSKVCVSDFGVGQSARSRVCCSFVVCGSVREWKVLGSILAGGWQVVASVYRTSPILYDLYCLPFRQLIFIIFLNATRV